jgi:hypothetical protein
MSLSFLSLAALSLALALDGGEPVKRALPQVEVSVPRGCYEAPLALQLSSPMDGASIRYTDDGSEPTLVNGKKYLNALTISKSPKHSFRLLFKEKYGAPKLRHPIFPDSAVEKFDTLVLRAVRQAGLG